MSPLIETFWEMADRYPEQTAIIDRDRRIKYGRLVSVINATVFWLSSNSLVKGDRVGIHLANSIEYVVLFYACWRAGYVPVALNTFASQREIEFWAKDSGCSLIFSDKFEYIPTPVPIYKILTTQNHVSINGQEIIESPDKAGSSRISLDDIASIIYTSGTTGNPKGITLSHRNIAANIHAIIKSLNISHEDVFLCVLPFFYSYGNSVLHSHLVAGATLVILNQVTYPVEILKTIERQHCNGFAGVPSLYITLLKKTGFRGYDLSSLRYMTQAGGPLSVGYIKEIHSLLPKVDFVIMYGQTEATSRISYLPARYLEQKPGSVGIGINGLTITIVDSDGQECRPNDTGEICVQGENIMVGYWGNPEATSEVLVNNKLHTGDMGYKDQDGFLYILGRQSEILKISDHRVSPYEIEEVLLLHEAVKECAVIGCEHQQMGQFAKAFVVINGGEIAESKLKKFCKQSLASYKIPKEIEFVESLPKTSFGKIKRNQLTC